MSGIKLKLSDIFKYIGLGAVELGLYYQDINGGAVDNIIDINIVRTLWTKAMTLSSAQIIIAACVFYVLGYLTQIVIQVFYRGNFLGSGIGEIACMIKHFPQCWMNRGVQPYPGWVYWSKRPETVIAIYKEILETEPNLDDKGSFIYANSLLQGILFVLILKALLTIAESCLGLFIIAGYFGIVQPILSVNANRNEKWIILNRITFMVILCIIMFVHAWQDQLQSGAIWVVVISMVMFAAAQLGRRQIRRIDILANASTEDRKAFNASLKQTGIPRAYILTRTDGSVNDCLREQLETVRTQDYPNIRSIILIDDNRTHDRASLLNLINDYRKQGLDIVGYISNGSGSAILSYEIRQIFINYADDDDIAIMLGADDLFASATAVSDIMTKMCRTEANVGILSFEIFGETKLNHAKNYHNLLAREYSRWPTSITPQELADSGKLHLISSLIWSKCYRKSAAELQQKRLTPIADELVEKKKYAGFLEILSLLSVDNSICAIEKPTILNRKRGGSVTSAPNKDHYDNYIPGLLNCAKELATGGSGLIANAGKIVSSLYIPYKFVQYLNIVYKMTVPQSHEMTDYSCTMFYNTFIEKIYSKEDEQTFRDGIIEILNQTSIYNFFDDLPQKVLDLFKEKKTLTRADFPRVANAYGLDIQ